MADFKIVVAGCGGMSHQWIEYALTRKDAEIVALVDLFEETAKNAAKNYALDCNTYTDISLAIKETGANLVFDVTIPASHKSITITALSLGCDVFGEKPMGESMQDAVEMQNAANEFGKSYVVMQNRRFNKQIRAFRDLVQSGEIGDQGFINADFFLGPHFGGFRDEMDSPLILDMAIHTFDQARFISGANPVSVYCHEFNPAGSWYKGNASAICIFEMDNGAVFNYRGSWSAEGAPTSWESSWRVVGSKGTAIWDGTHSPYAEITIPSNEHKFLQDYEKVETSSTYNGQDGHFGCLDEMFASLLEGRKAETDCTDNIHSVSMVYKAIESARTGKKVFF
ncbi:Gfo/Idh/MocA family oxidoreductase [Bacillus sp. FJAT-49711]|uniref:Gfo/Idh/MocA family protein n=1 Tax=Bacillus sp. FJAT-49711 TaxID=2833585 RepID=UPI001BC9ED8F|nr:Gfo/Idh/MocA family oxidoreductase [Bacillus sp. FJAT-49711]MBS4220794.1 Gfo/Idh/MocA family oxidoreductase [Bacillus sp. FJAT-49711]